MRIGDGGVGHQRAGAQEIEGSGNVVPGLVPVVGKPEQRKVREVERDKDQRKDQPQGKVLVLLLIRPFIGLCSLSSEEGNDGCLRQG